MTATASLKPRSRWPSYVLLGVMILLGVAIIGSLLYAFSSNAAPDATAAVQGNPQVAVALNDFYTFAPTGTAVDPSKAETGFIIYPGGLVDPVAYAVYASAIAASGYTTFITPMPLDLAVFNANAAQSVIAANPQITNWVIGGHSLGGAMAGQFIASHPDAAQGLVLLAAYPNGDLSGWDGQAVSIYGTLDGLASPEDVMGAQSQLPANTQFVAIEGGNHAQFGSYGAQRGDNAATVPAAEQLTQAVQATLGLLDQVNAGT